jgi:tRNA (Thr-GGU) A37 N-methylase
MTPHTIGKSPLGHDRPHFGLHRVTIVSINGRRVGVRDLEAVDRTPILDVKPVLQNMGEG